MTPKEKAKYLVEKHWVFAIPDSKGSWSNAKSGALITVNEIITNGFNPQLPFHYWENVKTEIEKL